MVAPRYTVIVPMHRYRSDEPILCSLRETTPALPAPPEIFVVEGTHPARQRNAALERAQGEIIVFLDNDCQLSPAYWEELREIFTRPEVEIVGGPVLLRPQATSLEKIFHALLTHPLVVGPVSARYRARGEFRPATQTELILCNMAARRAIFTRIGTLSTHLYPNEENEWLERVQVAGAGVFYNPKLQVFRPQRDSWGRFFKMLLRYGSGRTRQFWVSGWRATSYQFTPLILLVPVAAVLLGPTYLEIFFGLWLLVALVVAVTCEGRLKIWQRIVAGLAAPLIPLTYALGQLIGWPALLIPRPESDLRITLLNERGERIPPG
jgi:hypothetical protein